MIFPERIVDISGELVLTETGKVYKLTDTSKTIEGLPNIAKISSGVSYNLALSTDGILFKWSTGKTEGIEENIYEISAGNNVSIIETEDRKIYELMADKTEINIGQEVEKISCRRRNTSSSSCQRWICMEQRYKYIRRISNRRYNSQNRIHKSRYNLCKYKH